jgi:hypothetical protein
VAINQVPESPAGKLFWYFLDANNPLEESFKKEGILIFT